jgi:hypothetical protein
MNEYLLKQTLRREEKTDLSKKPVDSRNGVLLYNVDFSAQNIIFP